MIRPKDLTGQIFGRWTVVERVDPNNTKYTRWLCRCICGDIRQLNRGVLVSGGTNSCGCLRIELTIARLRKGKGVAAFNCLFSRYKKGAKRRGLSFELDEEEVKALIFDSCFYCNKPPSMLYDYHQRKSPLSKEWNTLLYNGIDRKMNSIGYTADNCVTSCYECNWAKGIASFESFIAMCNRVAKNHAAQA